jgi:hypothetical protein
VGPGAGLNAVEKRKILTLIRIEPRSIAAIPTKLSRLLDYGLERAVFDSGQGNRFFSFPVRPDWLWGTRDLLSGGWKWYQGTRLYGVITQKTN